MTSDEDSNSKRAKMTDQLDIAVDPPPSINGGGGSSTTTGWTGGVNVKVNEWQLFSPRLGSILELEKEDKPLTPELAEEKNMLFSQGFPSWDRNEFRMFVQVCAEKGREAIDEIAQEISTKTLDEISRYSHAFWSRGPECFTPQNWFEIVKYAGKGLKQVSDEDMIMEEVRRKLGQGTRLEFHQSLHSLLGQEFCQEEDKFLLDCYLAGKSKEEIRAAVLTSPVFAFDHYLRSLTADDLKRRLQILIEVVTRDAEENAKVETKLQREKEKKEQEDATLLRKEAELAARVEEVERMLLQGIIPAPTPLSPSSDNADPSSLISEMSPVGDEDGRQEDSDGERGGPVTTGVLDPKYHDSVVRMVVASGTCGMAQLVDKVTRMLPEGIISKRQLKRDIMRLAVKEKRSGDRAARWYARDSPVD